MPLIVCTPKSLTPSQAELALRRSVEVNPANAGESRTVARTPLGRRGGPRRLALLVGSRWPESGVDLSVQFLDNPSRELRSRILLHMTAWNKTANVRFRETSGVGQVRIARLDHPDSMAGYWSYVGTQILGIEDDQPTMNLEGFTMRVRDSEFHRVVRHEAGHTLGFEHEHMRSDLVRKIDPKKAIAYYDRECGWGKEETMEQVLTPLSARSLMATTESDPDSVMCYQIPAAITKDGKAIPGGTDISSKDFEFAATIYPKTRRQPDSQAAAKQHGTETRSVESSDPAADTFQLVVMDGFDPEEKSTENPKYARVFASYAGAQVTAAMRLRSGPAKDEKPTAFGRIIRMHERIKNYTNRSKGSLPSDEDMVGFGADLFEALFQGDVRRLYDEARARQQNRKLDIVLTSMIPWIAEKPWEFAYDAVRRSFLATEDVYLTRNALSAIPANVIAPLTGPMRILVAAAQPVGMGLLSIDQEVEVIRRGFQPLVDAELVTIEVLPRATPSAILARLSTAKFTIVHFIGHGGFDEKTQKGVLYFEDARGQQMPLGERSVREIFCRRGVGLVFLNSCQSGSGGLSDFNKGIAQALVAHGLPALIANQYSVLDSSATSFAQHFYWSLAQGMSVGQAGCEARIAVNSSMQGDLIDWAVPVVYARDPRMALCTRPAKSPAVPATSVRREMRHVVQGRMVRVAVWDIDNVFPALEQTLRQMNEAQKVFGFELVALSIPIDAWDRKNRASDGTPYLWAEKLAGRLGRATADLGVDTLACITRHWLRDEDTLNLFSWWPDEKKPPVMIFSCAGLDLPAAGSETDRAIANVIVSGLAGLLGKTGSHERGAKDCPLAYNKKRDLACITGSQKFDRTCRNKLQKKLPRELPALEALLKTF